MESLQPVLSASGAASHTMNEVVDMADRRPHLMIPGVKSVHVIPKSLIQAVINGHKDITEIEEYYDFLPTILKEWLHD